MDKVLITTLQSEFNQLSNTLEDSLIEYWFARDLQKVLGYERWENHHASSGQVWMRALAKLDASRHNVKQKNIYGENNITNEHIQNNESVRGLLSERGIKPEELPPAEDLKKLERRVKYDEKKMIKQSALPKRKQNKQ